MTDYSWLAALLAPRSVAPHPNFSSADSVTPAGLLALVALNRSHQIDDYRDRLVRPLSTAAETAIPLASMSFFDDSRTDSVSGLLTTDFDGDIGLQAASSLLAAVALAENDQHAEAMDVLTATLDVIDDSPGHLLLRGVLWQQGAMRLADADFDSSDWRQRALSELSSFRAADGGQFETSIGSPYSSSQTLANVKALLLDANRDLLNLGTRFPSERQLRRMIKQKDSPLTIAALSSTRAGLGAQLEDEFKTKLSSNEVRFANGDPVDDPIWRALTFFELSGFLTHARQHRKTLGQLRMFRETTATDGLRLLRQSRDMKSLKLGLIHIRNSGPLSHLHSEVRSLAERRVGDARFTEGEIALLEAGAQTLPQSTAEQVLRSLFSYPELISNGTTGQRLPVSIQFENWLKVVGEVAAVAEDQQLAASAVLGIADVNHFLEDDRLSYSVMRFLNSLDWSAVHNYDLRENWLQLIASSLTELTDDWRTLSDLIDPRDSDPEPEPASPRGEGGTDPADVRPSIGMIANHLNSIQAGGLVDRNFLDRARPVVADALAEISRDAENGAYSHYAVSPVEVAVGLCAEADVDLWREVFGVLADPRVPQGAKTRAFERLAFPTVDIPRIWRGYMVDHVDDLLSEPFRSPFEPARPSPSPSAVRALATNGVLPPQQILVAVSRMTSGDDRARLEGARTLSALAQARPAEAEWPVFAVMQLSTDRSAHVRAESGRALALLSANWEGSLELLDDRLVALLSEDGILVPLLTLRGLSEEPLRCPERAREAVREIAAGHISHGVRLQASFLSEKWADD